MRDSGADGKKPIKEAEKLCAQKPKLERVSHYITKDRKAGAVLTGLGVGVEQAKRKVGIDILGEVAWGTHFCIFYQSKQDLIDILVPYFKEGLEDNEFCMWITSEPLNAKEAKKSLKRAVKNLDSYIRKGQIEILDYGEWYTKSGKFEADRVLQGWIQQYDDAIKRGFDGLRLTGNTFWLEKKDWIEFIDYEESVNNIIGKYRMLAICTYSLDKCEAGEMIDVINNHQFVAVKHEGIWNILKSAKQRKMEQALHDSEKKYHFLFTNMRDGFAYCKIIVDENNKPVDFVYLEINDAFEKLTTLKRKDVIGKKATEAIPGIRDAHPELFDIYGKVALTGKGADFDIYLEPLKIWLSVSAYSPQKGYFVEVFENITKRKKAEAEARDAQQKLIEQQHHEKEHVEAELEKLRDELVKTTRLAAIGQVSASIAHDLRNPLGAVRNASYFLRRRLSKDKPKASEHLKIIDQEVAKADQIITNLLEMARPKASHKQVVDLAEIVKQVFGQAKGIEGVRCRTSLVPDPFMVRTDPNQLRQAISNIMYNAVYAMKGHGEFLVEATRDSDYDTLVFRDTGPGFDPEVRDRLFEPLVTTKASGTGLGLTICRQIVEKHGGTIRAEDCKGGGAVIRIRLPRQ